MLRFLLFAAALEHWVLRDGMVRAWLLRLVQVAALYIALQSLVQFASGRNLFGYPRGADGGADRPLQPAARRAALRAAVVSQPCCRPCACAALARPGWTQLLGSAAITGPRSVMVVLMGQRMPLLLAALGVFRHRGAAAAAARGRALGGAAVRRAAGRQPVCLARGALPAGDQVLRPDGGLPPTATTASWRSGPGRWCGRIRWPGWASTGSAAPATTPPISRAGAATRAAGATICVQHPHNFYLQAAVEAGLPGLLLFCAMALAWLRGLARGFLHDVDPRRAGLFIAALLHLWPIASSNAFTSMPISGWFFLLLGLGLAEARAYISAKSTEGPSDV